jgi:hypothetical protein
LDEKEAGCCCYGGGAECGFWVYAVGWVDTMDERNWGGRGRLCGVDMRYGSVDNFIVMILLIVYMAWHIGRADASSSFLISMLAPSPHSLS